VSDLQQSTPPRRKILSIDGGGIRCFIALEILSTLEALIQEATGDKNRRLCEHFDLIAGTSGGAILASAIAMGSPMSEIRDFTIANSKFMFTRSKWYRRHRSFYDKSPLEQNMKEYYGDDTMLGSERLKTLILLVMRNWSTDSPWLVSNNPAAPFNDRALDDCNLNLPLWQLARASAAAPAYYVPETIRFGIRNPYEFVFVDGGLTGFNNPAFKAFLYATTDAYGLNWAASESKLTVVSVGAGDVRHKKSGVGAGRVNVLKSVLGFPNAMLYSTTREQDLLCRTFGKCETGDSIDLEVGDMQSNTTAIDNRLFRYHRLNPALSTEGLAALGCADIKPRDVVPIDSVAHLDSLSRIGLSMTPIVKTILHDCL